MPGPRVLTFCVHEPYLSMMAATGLDFVVGACNDPALGRPWKEEFRPVPPNVSLSPESVWRRDLLAGRFDVVVTHSEMGAAYVLPACIQSKTSSVLVLHNHARFVSLPLHLKENASEELEGYRTLVHRLHGYMDFVFISESKKRDYDVSGTVILPGIDLAHYGGYQGDVREVLRVGNMMRERTPIFDVDLQERILQDLPTRVLGDNPRIPGSRPSASWDDLREQMRACRCYLHVTKEDWEDGYNLSMLEAMATGMPVVSFGNSSSPLTDGQDGFVSYDAEELNLRLRELLANPGLAARIGAQGRETAARLFPMNTFTEKWRQVLDSAASRCPRYHRQPIETPVQDNGGPHLAVTRFVPEGMGAILDVGCGSGQRAIRLRARGAKAISGVEIDPKACREARTLLEEVIEGDIETIALSFPDNHFDCVLCADILSALRDPWAVLRKLRQYLKPGGLFVVSVPNVAFWEILARLARGEWAYEEEGILKKSHLRFFSRRELMRLGDRAGLEMVAIAPLAMDPSETLPMDGDNIVRLDELSIGPLDENQFADLLTEHYVITLRRPAAGAIRAIQTALEEGATERALELAQAAKERGEDCRHLMAKAASRLGKLALAEELYRELLAENPADVEACTTLGILMVSSERFGEARILLETAIGAAPSNARAQGALGLALYLEGKPEEAFTHFRRSLELDSDNETILGYLLRAGLDLERLDDVAPAMSRFLQHHPGDAEVACQYAMVLHNIGKQDVALLCLDDLLHINPTCEQALDLRRHIQEKKT